MIKCNLQPMYQYTNIARKSKEKFGRYLSSWYPIKGIHKKKWVVGINVDVRDLQEHLDSGTSAEDIAVQCLKAGAAANRLMVALESYQFAHTLSRGATTLHICRYLQLSRFAKIKCSGVPEMLNSNG